MGGWFVRFVLLIGLILGQAAADAADCATATVKQAVGAGSISYKVAGSGPDVVLLHGLFAQKEQWDTLLCALASAGFRASALDLPGYAQSTGYDVEVYALENQARLIDELMRARNIDRFHLAGNSMGGTIAAIYAGQYPQKVVSLAFIGGPLGVGDWAGPVKRAILAGVNPFIPLDQAQLDVELNLLLVDVPQLPADVKQAMVAPYVDNTRHFRQVWDIVTLYGKALVAQPPEHVLALILWGQKDRIFDVADARPLARVYPNNHRVLLDNAGHLPMLDAPAATADAYVDFLRHAPPMAPRAH